MNINRLADVFGILASPSVLVLGGAALVGTALAVRGTSALSNVIAPATVAPAAGDVDVVGDGTLTASQLSLAVIFGLIFVALFIVETLKSLEQPPHLHSDVELASLGASLSVDAASANASSSSASALAGGSSSDGSSTSSNSSSAPDSGEDTRAILRALAQLGAILLMFWVTDGSHAWQVPQSARVYDRDLFAFLCLATLLGAYLTLRPTHKNTTALLNREQTEEWKGYMQIIFVLYHYFMAKEIYNMIRVFIACYVFLTGFGNFSYFWVHKDYSFVRFCKMFTRLNLLVFFVVLALDREYMLYYVCPLHTFYFLTVYVTMAIKSHLNTDPFWMKTKLILHVIILAVLFEIPSLFRLTFWPLTPLLTFEGSLHEWQFRATLDHYVCWIGMVAAYTYPNVDAWVKQLEDSPPARHYGVKAVILIITTVVLALWATFVLTLEKFTYNRVHPYTAWIPIFAMIIYRNIFKSARGWVCSVLLLLLPKHKNTRTRPRSSGCSNGAVALRSRRTSRSSTYG